jgi:SAM-dependent methyltransferase
MNIIKMKLKKRACPSCGSKKNEQFYKKKNFYRIDAKGKIYVRDNIYVSCKNCLLVYQNPHLDPKEFNKIYENTVIGTVFENSNKSKIHYHYFSKNVSKSILSKNKKLLEIGCATGTLLKNISINYKLKKNNILGIEPSKILFKQLKNNKYFLIKNTFIENLKEKKKFDFVIMDNVFEHLDYPNKDLKKIYDLLSNNGYLYISIPNIMKTNFHLTDPLNHTCNYNEYTIRKIFSDNNFLIKKINSQSKWLNFLAQKKIIKKKSSTKLFDGEKNKLQKVKKILQRNEKISIIFYKKLKKIEKNIKKNNYKIVLFGASNYALEIISRMNIKKNVICMVDSNKIYHNRKRLGFNVVSPNELVNINFDKILIASHKFIDEMISIILKLKISYKKIVKLTVKVN